MNPYAAERVMLEAHRSMVRAAEVRARLVPETYRAPLRRWMAGRLRTMADRLEGRRATAHLRVVP